MATVAARHSEHAAPAGIPGRPPRHYLSSEVEVALRPGAAFQRLLSDETPITWWRLVAQPATALLVIGVSISIMAVQQVTLGLVATASVSWSFAVAIQLLIGAAVIGSAPTRRVSLRRALDLWFAGHLPYSLWILLAATVLGSSASAPVDLVLLIALVPATWTTIIVSAFCRTVLETTPAGARWRAAAHQVLVWSAVLTFIAWSAGGWFRLLP